MGNENSPTAIQNPEWQSGDWAYFWNSNGMLQKVKRADGKEISFEYDALGRRISKIGLKKITRYIWDGNVLLHEWNYDVEEEPKTFVDDDGNVVVEKEKIENVVTWVYGGAGYTPVAKLVEDQKYSIISDYLGIPIQCFDDEGNLVWERELDIYGNVKKLKGDNDFIPFQFPGQYYDYEIELCYNRFRYYDLKTGNYISKDPIGFASGEGNFYSYVRNSNYWIDVFGLSKGGGYSGTRGSNVGGEVNHIPAWNSIEMAKKMNPQLTGLPTHGTTPSIHMDKPDHRVMSSTGSSNKSKAYRRSQAVLISQGKFNDAMGMDIDEMLEYAEKKGYITGEQKAELQNKYK